MDQAKLEAILGRKEYKEFINQINGNFIEYYLDEKILITGAEGSLGLALRKWFDKYQIKYVPADIVTGRDITSDRFSLIGNEDAFTTIFHFAAAKHAPEGEVNVEETVKVNVDGTLNLLKWWPKSKIVLSSTCKAIKPETVYGATKLVAERAVLNAGGTVARYFNVVQSSGNVFEIWDNGWEPFIVSDCWRYFISLDEAICLTLFAGMQESGRFMMHPQFAQNMIDICSRVYGDYIEIPRRRGDRAAEPLCGTNETLIEIVAPIYKVENYHD